MSDDVETYQVWHYGYHPRNLPCLADEPTCKYYDALWEGHDLTMVYSGIMWLVAGFLLLVVALLHRTWASERAKPFIFTSATASSNEDASLLPSQTQVQVRKPTSGSTSRAYKATAAYLRTYLLPDSKLRFVFGRTTRLQVLILALLVAYLTVFSFIGIVYELWTTEVPEHPGVFKYQNSLGIWSNRIGGLAYALTPFSVLLASRESILSALTGIPYQSFNFLHRWIGYIILVQGTLHAIAWTVICVGLYGPQPEYSINWITQEYMIYGIVAQLLIIIMVVLSFQWCIRLTGFEFFRKSHYILAMIYIGMCWGHWEFIGDWMLCGFLLWVFDRFARLVRTAVLHHQLVGGDWGFHPAQATVTMFPDTQYGDAVRLDFAFSQSPWKIGQHFYLCFPDLSVWQSHPFTPLSAPTLGEDGMVRHAYVLRAKSGETKKLVERAARRLAGDEPAPAGMTMPVIMQGPYGERSMDGIDERTNILAVAGGTGISYVLPVLLRTIQSPVLPGELSTRSLQLVWMVRRGADVKWIEPELELLRGAANVHGVKIDVYVTREAEESEKISPTSITRKEESESNVEKSAISSGQASSDDEVAPASVHPAIGLNVHHLGSQGGVAGETRARHPEVGTLVSSFVEQTVRGRTVVFASGPGGMITDLRRAVAGLNSGSKVWKGAERWDVELREDNRLEW